MPEEFFKVSEINRFIKDVLNAGIPQIVWVCGEIQQYDRNKNKNHIFFELVEKDPASNDIVARIGLVIFAGRKSAIENMIRGSGNAFSLKDDIEVKFACRVDYYSPHGAVRLIVEAIDPIYTLGKIAQEREKLIALLKGNGTLDKNKLVEFNSVPLRLGLITAYDSAAYNDFISELNKSSFGFKVYFRNTLMQGKKAEQDVVEAIVELENVKDLDAIVITRGGGSLADLSCFDSRLIAERIALCRYPVLSGIGHEINTTVTDLTAHTFAKTPTAIAHVLVSRVREFLVAVEESLDRIIGRAEDKLGEERARLKSGAGALHNGTLGYLKEHNERLVRIMEVIRHRPRFVLRDRRSFINDFGKELKRSVRTRFEKDQERLKNFHKMIGILHPVNTMKRGFSVTRLKTGKIVKSIYDVPDDCELVTELKDGLLESKFFQSMPGEEKK